MHLEPPQTFLPEAQTLHLVWFWFLDPIDIVTDPIPPHEYKAEEDTRLYKSAKTQRGPLQDDWIEDYNNNPGKTPIMCAYKLCKVEFRYWGMQSKIERFIHDVGKSALTDAPELQIV